jgi:hypothetical protein
MPRRISSSENFDQMITLVFLLKHVVGLLLMGGFGRQWLLEEQVDRELSPTLSFEEELHREA